MPQQHPNQDALEQALGRLYQAQPSPRFEEGWRAAVRREEHTAMSPTQSSFVSHRFWRVAGPVLAALVLTVGSLWAGTLEDVLDDAKTSASSSGSTFSQSRTTGSDAGPANYALMESETLYSDATSSRSASGGTANAGVETAQAGERKLVRTADLTLRTQSFEADAERIDALIQELDGYTESRYQYGDEQEGATRTLSLTARVPQESLDAFLDSLETIGRMVSRSESVTDLTVQYADNEARLATLREKLNRLNELLSQAQSVSDLVEIESAISDTQYEIDSYETSQRSIDRRADMSAVYVTLQEETQAQSATSAQLSLSERLSSAFAASVAWLGGFARNLVVFLAIVSPVAVPVALLAVAIWLIRRHSKRKKGADQP